VASYLTNSPEATETLAARLAPFVPPGAVLALYGDLAAGKTCFVRGLARFFAGDEIVHSPTFTLVNEYGTGAKLYHLDLYRLSGPEELADLGYEELFDSGDVCAVEWAERAEPLLPARRVDVAFQHGGGDVREVEITDTAGVLREGWERALLL
jgi:tRNA threonylcarbamoyladenosine biosynthesis protein TsaE